MEKKQLKDELVKLEQNYGKEKFKVTQELFNLWYEMFKDYDEKIFHASVNAYMKTSDFAPTVAGINRVYEAYINDHREMQEFMEGRYTMLMSVFGEEYDRDTMEEFTKYVFRFPRMQRRTEAIELVQRAISFYHDCIVCGRQDIPSIKEFLRGKR